jgi:hypothetical protein
VRTGSDGVVLCSPSGVEADLRRPVVAESCQNHLVRQRCRRNVSVVVSLSRDEPPASRDQFNSYPLERRKSRSAINT